MNKKTYISGLIALVVLIGVVWYATNNETDMDDQTSSALDSVQDSSEIIVSEKADDLVLGNPEAPVTIVEYSSHLCSHCIDFHNETLPLIMEKYIKTGQVKLISRYVSPLEIGIAILCAREENKALEVSDYFFENIQNIETVEDIRGVSSILELDQDEFNSCFDEKRYEDKIQEWFDQANEMEVEGTPTFFVNDQAIYGNQPYSVFEQAIEEALGQ